MTGRTNFQHFLNQRVKIHPSYTPHHSCLLLYNLPLLLHSAQIFGFQTLPLPPRAEGGLRHGFFEPAFGATELSTTYATEGIQVPQTTSFS